MSEADAEKAAEMLLAAIVEEDWIFDGYDERLSISITEDAKDKITAALSAAEERGRIAAQDEYSKVAEERDFLWKAMKQVTECNGWHENLDDDVLERLRAHWRV